MHSRADSSAWPKFRNGEGMLLLALLAVENKGSISTVLRKARQ